MRVVCLITLAMALLLCGCGTKNIGSRWQQIPYWGPPPGGAVVSTPTVPTGLFAQDEGDFSVTWTAGFAPYTISWSFGGGANPNTVGPVQATSPNAQKVRFSENEGGTFNVIVTVTDALGRSKVNQTTYTYGPRQNAPPVLSIAAGAGGPSITIHGLDPEGDAITVTPTAPAGLSTSGAKTIPASAMGGDVTFDFNPNDLLNGASGTAEFYGEDGFPRDEYVTVSASVVVPPITLDPDTLYAIPMQRSAAAGDTVTIVVATGVPAHAFQFLNSCRVTAPTGFSYVSNTFNAGEPGGGAGDVDGFWTSMNPGGGFLLPPDNFIVETDLGSGLIGIDFNLTPIGGSDVSTDKGALFNFGANFGVGDNTLGFQAVSGVSRTYYTDSNLAPERFWSDITNDHAGVPNSVEVN